MIEQASVDARRRLVLIRRDGVEHLIMTGGPVDVVIETGIQPRARPSTAARGAGRSGRPRLHAPAAQPRSSRQRMNHAYFRRQRLVLLAALLVAIAWIAPAAAQAPAQPSPQPDTPPRRSPSRRSPRRCRPPSRDSVTRLTSAIESAEKTIQHLAELEEELGGLRVNVETILSEFDDTAETLRPQLAAVRSQIEKLGPPPDKDGASEAPALAAERARLTALESDLDAAIKSTVLTWERARQLIEKITVLRHSLFTRNIMERRPSPLLPGVWRDVLEQVPCRRPPHRAISATTGCTGPTSSGRRCSCCSERRSSCSSCSSTPSPG